MWKLDHRISATDVDVEEQRLAWVLSDAGYDVGKLRLNGLAQQVLAERAKATVMAIKIEPSNWHTTRSVTATSKSASNSAGSRIR